MAGNLPKNVVDFLLENGPPPGVGPEDLTANSAAEVWDVTKTTAMKRLDKMVEEGKLTREARTGKNGQTVFCYLPNKGKKRSG